MLIGKGSVLVGETHCGKRVENRNGFPAGSRGAEPSKKKDLEHSPRRTIL